jgi:hypothetical protein
MKKVSDADIAKALRDHGNRRQNAATALGVGVWHVNKYAERHNVPMPWIIRPCSHNSKETKILEALAANANDRFKAAAASGTAVDSVERWARVHKITLAPRPEVEKRPQAQVVRWDDSNVAKLRAMYLQVPTPSKAEMAAAFGCTESSIQTVLSRKGLARFTPTAGAPWKNDKLPLNCLCCRRPFVSEGIHNRQCPACYAENSEMAA